MSRHDRTAMGLVYALLIALGFTLLTGRAWPLATAIVATALYAGWHYRDRLPVDLQRWLNDWRCGWGYVSALLVTLILWGAA